MRPWRSPKNSSTSEPELVSPATGRPLTNAARRRRRLLLEAAEVVFAEQGYHEASIVKITERAGIGLGTFYLYFDSKQSIFEALVIDLNRRVRHSMSEAMAGATSRLEAERAGFPASSASRRSIPRSTASCARRSSSRPRCCACTTRASSRGTRRDSAPRSDAGDVDPVLDPETTAWALMGMGELIGMRFLLWERDEAGTPRLSSTRRCSTR